MVNDPLCNNCKELETYEHYFITCTHVSLFWQKINNIFIELGISCNMATLKHVILGYKINQKDYFQINEIISLIGFAIYKSYYVSENRVKRVNIMTIFKNEFKILHAYLSQKHKNTGFLQRFSHILSTH